MPWKKVTIMSQRKEFTVLAMTEGANISQLCRGFGISRKTGYKWIDRFADGGDLGLRDRSRRPHLSPLAKPKEVEEAVLRVRELHPAWGGRKIRTRLSAQGRMDIPAASTITAILRRRGRIDLEDSLKRKAWQRFEAKEPNHLWQMDFKGSIEIAQGRCHPLTVLDDHSRYSLGLEACEHEQGHTVQARLTGVFERYGLPKQILVDNGAPWGSDQEHVYTPLTVWMIRLGMAVIHARPYHPQTLGKDERFHRTLKAEVLQYCTPLDLAGCQRRFDEWRAVYNFERPHEALDMMVPASRYRISPRSFPKTLPPVEYGPDDEVRKVQNEGWFSYRGREYKISKAFRGEYVALRPTSTEGTLDVFFCNHKVAKINLNDNY
jgi:transposase InsO family protein